MISRLLGRLLGGLVVRLVTVRPVDFDAMERQIEFVAAQD